MIEACWPLIPEFFDFLNREPITVNHELLQNISVVIEDLKNNPGSKSMQGFCNYCPSINKVFGHFSSRRNTSAHQHKLTDFIIRCSKNRFVLTIQ